MSSPASSSRPADKPRRSPALTVPRGGATAADGLLLIDKPAGVTSHDVVGATRRLAATRKVGHAGTLDPMATGLLTLGIGRATRFLTYLVGEDKTYTATIRLGQETLTEDAEGEITSARGARLPLLAGPEISDAAAHRGPWPRLSEAMAGLTGPLMQVPSAVSAIKVDGVRSYARVRGGEDVELAARPVTIHSFELLGQPSEVVADDGTPVVDVDVEVRCSSGTYIRALARDLGAALGCGAHLTALRRVAVGPFHVEEAWSVPDLAAVAEHGVQAEPPTGVPTLSMEEVARRCFASVELTEAQARGLAYGQPQDVAILRRAEGPGRGTPSAISDESVVAGFAPNGRLVALLTLASGRAKPVLVLAPAGQ